MEDISNKLIKNGIQALIEDEELYFKNNLIHSLSIKLNTAISQILNETYQNLLYKQENLNEFLETKLFIDVLNTKQKILLKDNSIINITENDARSLTLLFENLNTKNKETMVKSIFNSSLQFNQHLNLANKVKGLFK